MTETTVPTSSSRSFWLVFVLAAAMVYSANHGGGEGEGTSESVIGASESVIGSRLEEGISENSVTAGRVEEGTSANSVTVGRVEEGATLGNPVAVNLVEGSTEQDGTQRPWYARLTGLIPCGGREENQMSLEEQQQRHEEEEQQRAAEIQRRAEEEQIRRVPWYVILLAVLPIIEADIMIPRRDQREWALFGRRLFILVCVLAFLVFFYLLGKGFFS